MATQLKNKRIELTTRYFDTTCVVTAYGFRKNANEQWNYYLKDSAVRAAEKNLVVGDNCLMLTPKAAEIVGDEINVVASDKRICPIYDIIKVKRGA